MFRVAAGYFVLAWLMIQAADILLGNFGAPDWVFRALVLVLAAGFPLALAAAWTFEVASKRRIGDSSSQSSKAGRTGTVVGFVGIGAMALVLAWLAWDLFRAPPGFLSDRGSPSIAVLPFSDMSPDGDQEYFAHGLSEEILNLLAGISELKVTGRTSSFAFQGKDVSIPEIGRALGVANVLEGSVRKFGDQVRVTAQLISTDDGFHRWSENYDRELTDIFAIQDEIAEAIASKLRLSLVDADGRTVSPNSTSSISAYERYLEARRLVQGRSVAGLQKALELLGEALTRDPSFAPAMAESALARLMLSDAPITPGDEPLDAAIKSAEPMLERALEQDPRLAAAHAVRGLLHILRNEPEPAEASLARALELNPSHSDALNWRAINLRSAGRLRDEVAARESLADIDPLHISNLFNLSIAYLLRGQMSQALDAAQRLTDEFPDSPWGDLARVEVLLAAGELAQAQRISRDRLAEGNSMLSSSAADLAFSLGEFQQAMELSGQPSSTALVEMGRPSEAVEIARERADAAPEDRNAALALLQVLSRTGRHEAVLDYFKQRWGSLEALQSYFTFDDMTAEVTPIAAAQSILGRTEALERTLAHWSKRLGPPRKQGYGMPYFRYLESGFEALSGNRDKAVALLTEALDRGYRDVLLDRRPAFHSLHDDPAFKRLVERNFELINAEREALDLPPIQATLDSAAWSNTSSPSAASMRTVSPGW